MSSSIKPWVVVAAGGIIETALLPYHLAHLKSFLKVDMAAAVSPEALNFITEMTLKAITGKTVYHENQIFDPITGKPLHLSYSEADLLIIYPATARIIAQCALGEVTCPVTRLFAFSPKEQILVSPAIHPRMDLRIYKGHIKTLQELGCKVLEVPAENSLSYSLWSQVEKEIARRLSIKPSPPPLGGLALWPKELETD